MSAPVSVVIVHWNQSEACLATIEAYERQGVALRFIVADNASRPEHVERLRSAFADRDDVTLLEGKVNNGFGGGANAGLAHWLAEHDSDWALLSPHDVELGPDCIADLLAAARAEPMAGLACADVGDGMTPYIDPYFGGMTMPGDPTPGWQPAAYPHGTLMALRRECLAEIGLFDEDYFAYCEEADLAVRAARAGWTCGLVRGARVQNVTIGSSVALVEYLQTRNTLRFVRKYSGNYHAFIRLMIHLIQAVRWTINPEVAPYIFDRPARLLGVRDFLLGRVGAPPPEVTGAAR
ncbi:MAG: glycosyltransferase family 2 protein [Actinobacteria bacterium]|nr:glycosyltransferase family 2 protein [Actinomycetota bacterium]